MVTAGAAGMETEASVFLIFLVQVSHRAIQRPLQVPRMMGSGGGEVWGPGRGCSFPRQVRALPGSAGLRTERWPRWKPQTGLIRMLVHRRYSGPASHEPASRGPSGLRPGSPPAVLERLRSSCGDAGRAGRRVRAGGPWADCQVTRSPSPELMPFLQPGADG